MLQKGRDIFNADKIGHWGSVPLCGHTRRQEHIVVSLKLMSVPFGWRPVARIVRPLLNKLEVFRKQDSYDHLCIFVDTRCKRCQKQSVYTLQFQKNGPSKRRGYYKHGARQQDVLACNKNWEVQWDQVCQMYEEAASRMGTYSITSHNCQDFTRYLWPKLKAYAWSCK